MPRDRWDLLPRLKASSAIAALASFGGSVFPVCCTTCTMFLVFWNYIICLYNGVPTRVSSFVFGCDLLLKLGFGFYSVVVFCIVGLSPGCNDVARG